MHGLAGGVAILEVTQEASAHRVGTVECLWAECLLYTKADIVRL
jgi:hypothetical protein